MSKLAPLLLVSILPLSALADPMAQTPEIVVDMSAWDAGPSSFAGGDVNGDGINDVIVGSGGTDGRGGAVLLYLGSLTGIGADPDQIIRGLDIPTMRSDMAFGSFVRTAGDVNGDGYEDIVVGHYLLERDLPGSVWVIFGASTGFDPTPLQIDSPDLSFGFGGSAHGQMEKLTGAGDLDGDGYADIAVGDRLAGPEDARGRVYVYRGGPAGPATTPDAALVVEVEGGGFPDSLVGGMDVNSDGFDDIVATSISSRGSGGYYPNLVLNWFPGGPGGIATTPAQQQVEDYGLLDVAGDFNADGYDDIAQFGSEDDTEGEMIFGFFTVSSGSREGLDVAVEIADAAIDDGTSLGDVDGDGFDDIAFSYIDVDWVEEEGVRIIRGASTGIGSMQHLEWDLNPNFGAMLHGVGDINGDGFKDLATLGTGGGTMAIWLGCPSGDADGDGSYICGAHPDCDDIRPDIHPGMLDIPNDGIDQDCDGSDAQSHVDTGGGQDSADESEDNPDSGEEVDDATGRAAGNRPASGCAGGCTTAPTPARLPALALTSLVLLRYRRRWRSPPDPQA